MSSTSGSSGSRRVNELPIPERLDATLVLVRHGESTWVAEGRFQGRADVPLSPLGERQAALVAGRLRGPSAPPALPVPAAPPSACWHSPLRRAASTAERIAERQDQPVTRTPDPRLSEIDQGAWQGLTHEEVKRRDPEILRGWRNEPATTHAPGGESLADVAARVRPFLVDALASLGEVRPAAAGGAELVPGYGGDDGQPPWGILVAHDGVFRVLLLQFLGLPLEAFWRFPFALCGISVLDVRNGRPSLRAHNLVEHLAPLATDREIASTADRQGAM